MNFLPKDLPKLKKTLFRLYMRLNFHTKTSRILSYSITLLSIALNQLQIISISVFAGSNANNYSNTGFIQDVFLVIRPDILLVRLGYQ